MKAEYNKNFYCNFHKFAHAYMNLIYDLKITGLENIPKDSNYILAGNHLNILDSWLLLACDDNYIRFLVDNKLYRYKYWELFFKTLGTIGTNPDSKDMESVKEMVKLLNNGETLAIFPEGHTHDKDIDLTYKPGVAKLSRVTNVPVVPFGIYGSYKPFSTIDIQFGEAINYKQINLPNNKIDYDLELRIKQLIKKVIHFFVNNFFIYDNLQLY